MPFVLACPRASAYISVNMMGKMVGKRAASSEFVVGR
jgi:hypothetical protein